QSTEQLKAITLCSNDRFTDAGSEPAGFGPGPSPSGWIGKRWPSRIGEYAYHRNHYQVTLRLLAVQPH
ncbi:MAG: hypothetical protein ACK5PZ_07430, partial [Pirellula sp.]